VLSTIASR